MQTLFKDIYQTTCSITKHLLVYKSLKKKAPYIVLYNTSNNINHFLAILEAKAKLEPAKKND